MKPKKPHLFLLLLLVISPLFVHAQREGNIWYFGEHAGLDFNYSPPKVLTNSAMNTLEGCATVSNKAGQLLFYTDGKTVWNRTHQVMKNGTGLKGHSSSTQSSVVVPKPNDLRSYYIFTVDGITGRRAGCYYNELDLDASPGGEVVQKNQVLVDRASYQYESIGATRHNNSQDYWVCYVENGTKILSYRVTEDGVTEKPVESILRPDIKANSSISHYMKFSPDNKFMVVNIQGAGLLLSKFNDQSGSFSNTIVIPNNSRPAYGLEFSPDSKLLYTSNGYQYDISTFDSAQIESSRYRFASLWSRLPGALQLGPDGKIYHAENRETSVGVIEAPNLIGPKCSYQGSAIKLQARTCLYGLPTFLQTYLFSGITSRNLCIGDTTRFTLATNEGIDSVVWNLGDTGSIGNISRNLTPQHVYSDTGQYTVTALVYAAGEVEQYKHVIEIKKPIPFSLGPDTVLCEGQTMLVKPDRPLPNYFWQDGSRTPTYDALGGTYHLTTYSGSCVSSDTMTVSTLPPTKISITGNSQFCEGETSVLRTTPLVSGCEWSDNSNADTLIVSKTGMYWFTVNHGCYIGDTIEISVRPLPEVNLGPDQASCFGDTVILDLSMHSYHSHLWSDGTRESSLLVNRPGTYSVEISDGYCFNSDMVTIKDRLCPPIIDFPNIITPNNDRFNDVFRPIEIRYVAKADLHIYNRWGEEVARIDALTESWDASTNGVPLPDGTYFYTLFYAGYDGLENSTTGILTIVR